MSVQQANQQPVQLIDQGKRGVRTQFGALCWRRRGDEIEVLLVTSRRRKRWIVPKGWPADRMTPSRAAMTEAWEEAGAKGKVSTNCLGIYSYHKELDEKTSLPCIVAVFPMRVKKLHAIYPERPQRKRKWFSQKKAAKLVAEPELSELIARFDPTEV